MSFPCCEQEILIWRLLDWDHFIGRDSCRDGTLRTVFLPVFVSDGSSIFTIAHAAIVLCPERAGTMCKRMFCLYTLLSGRFNPSGSRQLVCKWWVFSVSKMRGYLPEEECTQRNWQAERQWNLVYHLACSCSGRGFGISRYLKKQSLEFQSVFLSFVSQLLWKREKNQKPLDFSSCTWYTAYD